MSNDQNLELMVGELKGEMKSFSSSVNELTNTTRNLQKEMNNIKVDTAVLSVKMASVGAICILIFKELLTKFIKFN